MAGKLPAISVVQGDCETVYQSAILSLLLLTCLVQILNGCHSPYEFGSEATNVITLFVCTMRWVSLCRVTLVITLRLRQSGRHFADDISKITFLYEICCILIKISMKFFTRGPINMKSASVQITAWHKTDDKPLSEPMMANFMPHLASMS